MPIQKVYLPTTLSITNCIDFSNALFQTPLADGYEFDFGNMRWFPPFSMLYLSSQINRFRRERQGASWTASNFGTHTYAAHMGFFKSFGLDHGNDVGQALGSETYIPLTKLSRRDIVETADRQFSAIGEIIEQRSHSMAAMLTREEESNLFATLKYSIREIIRNSAEHSQSLNIYLCAQYWPSQGKVEVGICDEGIGLRQSLSNNPHLRMVSDRDALNLSILPGISGVAYEGIARNPYDAWANSGYGLFMTSKICSKGGSFFLSSGEHSVLLSTNTKDYFSNYFSGTAIRMVLNVSRVGRINDQLNALASEGQRLAQEIGSIGPQGPSIVTRVSSMDSF